MIRPLSSDRRTRSFAAVLPLGLLTFLSTNAAAQTAAPPPIAPTSTSPETVTATTPVTQSPSPPVSPPSSSVMVGAVDTGGPNGVAKPSASAGLTVEFSSLRLMLAKGIITQAEYDSALADIAESTGDRAAGATSLVVGKWSTTLYGFAETDLINDSTESFNDIAGNAQVARPNGSLPIPASDQNTYPGNHGRTQMSVRNSRLGLRLRAPETHGVRASGLIEADFEGYLPSPSATSGPTESQFFSSPSLRIRHAMLKLETPVVDVLVGQYWDLFGWQNVYHPNSVEIQGLPGELYSRDAQVRLTRAFRSRAVDLEIAVAARRPPSRDSQIPEGQGGLRVAFPGWTGVTTTGATATSVMPASIALTGDVRQFTVPEFSQTPTRTVSLTTGALAVDAFIPVIPQRRADAGNALSLTGEFVTGSAISDLYTGLNFGITFPTIVNTSAVEMSTPLPYPQDVDNGMVIFDTSGNLHGIQVTTFLVGAQYYLPALRGRVWVSGNFARVQSGNIAQFTRNVATDPTDQTVSQYAASVGVRKAENFFDANLFWDVVPGARLGVEYANFNDQYVDGVHAINNRYQLSGYFIF